MVNPIEDTPTIEIDISAEAIAEADATLEGTVEVTTSIDFGPDGKRVDGAAAMGAQAALTVEIHGSGRSSVTVPFRAWSLILQNRDLARSRLAELLASLTQES